VKEVESLRGTMEQLRAEIQLLKEELATHKRKKFGAGSERLKLLKPEDTPKPERKKRKPRKDTRAAVEQETERRHVPNEDRICECGCGRVKKVVSEGSAGLT